MILPILWCLSNSSSLLQLHWQNLSSVEHPCYLYFTGRSWESGYICAHLNRFLLGLPFYAEVLRLEHFNGNFSLKRLNFHHLVPLAVLQGQRCWVVRLRQQRGHCPSWREVAQGAPQSERFRMLGEDIEKMVTWRYNPVRTGLPQKCVQGCAQCSRDCTGIFQFKHN